MKVYYENVKKYEVKAKGLKQVLSKLSLLRLVIFVLASALLIAFISMHFIAMALVVFSVAAVCFAFVLKRYNKKAYAHKYSLFLKGINEQEILRHNNDLEGFDAGDAFIDPNHPYTSDLDVFGQHSIFQLLNRTTTESGRIRLAEWLSHSATNAEVQDRQEAIKELAQKLEWRQDFQASGLHFQNKNSDYKKLLEWVEAPAALLKNSRVYTFVAIALSLLSWLAFYFYMSHFDAFNWFVYLLPLITVLVVINRVLKRVKSVTDTIVETSQDNINTLRGYRSLIHKIELERFKSKQLVQLQSVFIKSKYSACQEINTLCRLLEFVQQRGVTNIKRPIKGNPFYGVFNSFFLLDIYVVIRAERWKEKNKPLLRAWAEVVSEFEVISSFAGFCSSNPSYVFPELTEQNKNIHFESLGHPLIKANQRVCNDFKVEGQGHVVMITGSNMAGKSTFLRTVGINLVLALAGAPICALKGQVPNLKLYSSMRTQDSLKAGVSSFYAELSRIETMLKMVEQRDDVFFLLDEMFKGTNSEDRHRGGFSLISQLSELKTSGIIATHDIDLAKLSGHKNLVCNYSFNSEIKDDTMVFSYHLDGGICSDFNASALMEKSGIKILSDPLRLK